MDILGFGVNAIEKNSLLGEIIQEDKPSVDFLEIDCIRKGKYQPRRGKLNEVNLEELASSIKEQGVLQPIIVRPIDNDSFEIIAGERRYSAAVMAGLTKIPVIVKNVSQKHAYAIALIENIQREQLNILDEAEGLLRLKNEYKLSAEETAKSVGKPRSSIANLIRLASQLSSKGKVMLQSKQIEYGHARAVLSLEDWKQYKALEWAVKKGASVRALEYAVKNNTFLTTGTPVEENAEHYLADIIARKTSSKANVKIRKDGSYSVRILFKDKDSLDNYFEICGISDE